MRDAKESTCFPQQEGNAAMHNHSGLSQPTTFKLTEKDFINFPKSCSIHANPGMISLFTIGVGTRFARLVVLSFFHNNG